MPVLAVKTPEMESVLADVVDAYSAMLSAEVDRKIAFCESINSAIHNDGIPQLILAQTLNVAPTVIAAHDFAHVEKISFGETGWKSEYSMKQDLLRSKSTLTAANRSGVLRVGIFPNGRFGYMVENR